MIKITIAKQVNTKRGDIIYRLYGLAEIQKFANVFIWNCIKDYELKLNKTLL